MRAIVNSKYCLGRTIIRCQEPGIRDDTHKPHYSLVMIGRDTMV